MIAKMFSLLLITALIGAQSRPTNQHLSTGNIRVGNDEMLVLYNSPHYHLVTQNQAERSFLSRQAPSAYRGLPVYRDPVVVPMGQTGYYSYFTVNHQRREPSWPTPNQYQNRKRIDWRYYEQHKEPDPLEFERQRKITDEEEEPITRRYGEPVTTTETPVPTRFSTEIVTQPTTTEEPTPDGSADIPPPKIDEVDQSESKLGKRENSSSTESEFPVRGNETTGFEKDRGNNPTGGGSIFDIGQNGSAQPYFEGTIIEIEEN